MKIVRVPTGIIMKYPSCKHLIGKWWYDVETKFLLKGDKTLRKKKKEIKKVLDKSSKA